VQSIETPLRQILVTAKAKVYAYPVRTDGLDRQPRANARGPLADDRQAEMVVLP
jgi:hypothetical protein